MGIVNIINLLGGLGLFLFGMRHMSDGINQVAGEKMKNLLEKLTRNRFKGFLLGVLVTCIIQSSSATTVMVMGFLNAGIMDLAQATGVIIGANIGTTITAVLIAIDVSAIAPICIFVGTAMVMFSKKHNMFYIGQIILGFGILFFGLKYMSGDSAMGVLKTSAAFQSFITKANNPFLGIAIGLVMCSILQSSSAAVGVLQVLALGGLMPLKFAIFIIIGINVGSATPLFLSAIGAKTNAKRAAIVYFIFDFTGMLLITPIAMLFPFTDWIETLSTNGSVQVAIGHIIFKVATAVVLLPLVKTIVKITEKVIPEKEHESTHRFIYIDKTLHTDPASTALQVGKEVERMSIIVRENFVLACEAFLEKDTSNKRDIEENEDLVNWLNHNITDYLVSASSRAISGQTSEYFGQLFGVISDLERIGDHSINILQRTQDSIDQNLDYSDEGRAEFKQIYEDALNLLDGSVSAFVNRSLPHEEASRLHAIEDEIDTLTEQALDNHVERLREKKCHTLSGIVFTKAVQDLERVGDHAYNIAWDARKNKKLIKSI